jgi:hypothetical protein
MSKKRHANYLLGLFLFAASLSWAAAPDLEFHAPSSPTDAAAAATMRDLATRLVPIYEEPDRNRYLANLFALQMVSGNFAAADVSRQSLRERRRKLNIHRPIDRDIVYDLYAYAKALEVENKVSFTDGFTRSFHEVIGRLNDHDAYAVTRWLGMSLAVFREALQKSLDQRRTKDIIDQSDAVELLWKYLSFDAYRSFGPLVGPLTADDDRRRYSIEDAVLVKTSDGPSISALVVRPKGAGKPLPALLEFTIYDTQSYAMECASYGYAGVVAFTRGKHTDPRTVVPYQHDGDDARAVIDWIAKQPWSDGRVGMYGDGYSGFTAWAAAKRPPAALKAIATSVSGAPGIDFPMAGSIFQNSAYRWSSFVTNTDASEEKSYNDDARSDVVQKRKAIPGLGPPVRKIQSDFHPLAESPQLRPVLAKYGAVPRRILAHQHPGVDDHGLLCGKRTRRPLLFHPAPAIQSARRPHAAHRTLRRQRDAARAVCHAAEL